MAQCPIEGNVVQDFMIGNTRVKICDDYCRDKTQKDIEEILQRIAQRAQRAFTSYANHDVA